MTMFNAWRLVILTRNQSDGEAEFTMHKNTEKEAFDAFYKACNDYGTNPATKACAVYLFDTDGNLIRPEKIDNARYEVAPSEEPVVEEE